MRLLLVILIQIGAHHAFFAFIEPARLFDAIFQHHQHHTPHQNGRDRLQHEHPLPAGPAVRSGEGFHNPAGERAADHAGKRNGDEPEHRHARPTVSGKPVGEIEQQPGRQSGFGHAQQEAQQIELPGSLDKGEGAGDQAPGDHNAGDPAARADAMQDQVAGHLKEKVTEKKDPGAEAVDRFAQREIVHHLQLGEADVDAIQIGAEVTQH